MLLKHCIEEFEDLPTDKFIIPINNDEDIMRLAIGIGSHSQIVQLHLLLVIFDHNIPLLVEFLLLNHDPNDIVSSGII
jgi:hypothetical protein